MVRMGLEEVARRMRQAEQSVGRVAGATKLIAVSKSQPAEAVREAYEAGQRDFGENYVQELADKAAQLADLMEIRWHMIGHLQTNKVRQVVGLAQMIQTIDRPRVASEVAKHASAQAQRMAVMIEVNVGGEEQKSGVAVGEVGGLIEVVRSHASLDLRGLMTVPPFDLDVEQTRQVFDELRAVRDAHGGVGQLPELSMGMSHDFEVAIAAGATMVRVGTAIFGARARTV